ncbi:MAG TPA: hypothetical protein ENK08_05300 [Chloroflexi bacterium]|nr:hypothetical protein [Chloroflexota bacterium]
MSSRDLSSFDPLDRMVKEALQARFAGAEPSPRVWRRIRREAVRQGGRHRSRGIGDWAWFLLMARPTAPLVGRDEFPLGRFGLGMFLFPDAATLMTLRFGW